MNQELYTQIKNYISQYGHFSVGFFPVPIPDLDIKLEHSESFPQLKELLNDYWWSDFASKCGHLAGYYEFNLLSNGDFKISSSSSEDNFWTEENKNAFINELVDYGFVNYLKKFYNSNFVEKLIEDEVIPASESEPNDMDDVISGLLNIELDYNSKKGFNKLELIINEYNIDPESRLFYFTKRILNKTFNKLKQKYEEFDVTTKDENKLLITHYYNLDFVINKPSSI
jgi:hypothetical protein